MFFDEIIHGTQYYRTPTPLPEEWESDIANFEKFNLDVMQIRMNWRWNERIEDQYDFSDVDRLLELAEKYNRKVVMKFLLECAPQYIYEKYGGTRIGPKGELLRPGAHGAFYGGWLPCFTNPHVVERATKFVEKCVERYAGNKNIIIWHTWNEIRNKPVEECFCPHCKSAFGKFLEKKYGTIEKLNAHYGAAEESFETINLPVMAHGFWDIYEFKKFKGSQCLYNNLRFVYDAIRKYDKTTPIMSHAGVCSAFQTSIGDVCDDFNVSKAVDFWGTSLPFATNMDTHENRVNMWLLSDYMRSVDKNFFIHEIYPGLGMFKWYDTPFDMKFKLYTGLSSGAKGLVYWQYRAERVGHEHDCSGIMRMDGSPKDVAYEVRDFGDNLKRDMEYFVKAAPEKPDAAIVYDFNSQLMGEIEEASKDIYDLTKESGLHYYNKAHRGMYQLVRDAGYDVDYVGITRPEEFKNYKVLLFPYCTMLDKAIVPYLQEFLENGGIIFADEGFGMRQSNTWMQVYDIDVKPIMDARMIFRRVTKDSDCIDIDGHKTQVMPYVSEYRVDNASVLKRFGNGNGAMFAVNYGKGKLYLNGFSSGFSYFTTQDPSWLQLIDGIMQDVGSKKYALGNFADGVYERRMRFDHGEIIFIFNNSGDDKTMELDGNIISSGADAIVNGNAMTVKSGEIGYAIVEVE